MTIPLLRIDATVPAYPLGRPADRERFSMTPHQAAVYRWLVACRPRQGTPHAPQARGPVAPEPAPAQGPRLPQALLEGLHMSEWLHLFMTDADTFLFSIFVGTMMFSAVVVSLR